VSEQFLNGTSAQYRLCSAMLLTLHSTQQMLHVQSPGGRSFLVKWRHGHHVESVSNHKFCSINRCIRKNCAKFHPDPIWNCGAL